MGVLPNYEVFAEVPDENVPEEEITGEEIEQWILQGVESFSVLIEDVHKHRKLMRSAYPKMHKYPKSENGWCRFILGSEWASCIYGETHEGWPRRGHLPIINILIHLRRKQIMFLIKCIANWIKIIGMDEELAAWLFGLLASLTNPIAREDVEFLEEFYFDIQKEEPDDFGEELRLYLFGRILAFLVCIYSRPC